MYEESRLHPSTLLLSQWSPWEAGYFSMMWSWLMCFSFFESILRNHLWATGEVSSIPKMASRNNFHKRKPRTTWRAYTESLSSETKCGHHSRSLIRGPANSEAISTYALSWEGEDLGSWYCRPSSKGRT